MSFIFVTKSVPNPTGLENPSQIGPRWSSNGKVSLLHEIGSMSDFHFQRSRPTI